MRGQGSCCSEVTKVGTWGGGGREFWAAPGTAKGDQCYS